MEPDVALKQIDLCESARIKLILLVVISFSTVVLHDSSLTFQTALGFSEFQLVMKKLFADRLFITVTI